MLCLNLNQGEYMTIGEDVVVQLDHISGDRCKLVIHAPREVPILRSELRVAAQTNREAADEAVSPLELLDALKGQEK